MMQISRVREPNKKNSQGGFTLFELLVVISIMAVLLGISLPALNIDSGKGAFSEFERTLGGGVSEARYLAMITGKVQTLTFSGKGKVRIKPSGISEASLSGEYEILSVEDFDGKNEVTYKIMFFPSGLAEPAVIHVKNSVEEKTFYIPPVAEIESRMGIFDLDSFQE